MHLKRSLIPVGGCVNNYNMEVGLVVAFGVCMTAE
jgi:hypothetical protein